MLPWDSMHPLLWTDAEVDLLEDTYAYEEIMQFRDQVSGFVRAALYARLCTHVSTHMALQAPRVLLSPPTAERTRCASRSHPLNSTGKHASTPPFYSTKWLQGKHASTPPLVRPRAAALLRS